MRLFAYKSRGKEKRQGGQHNEKRQGHQKAISKEHGIKMSQIEVYEGWYITDEQEGFDYGINLKHATIGFTCKIDIYGTVTEIKRKTTWDKN